MKLIGMLDSPYVRRVAVSLKLMGVPFEHEAVSVFRHYERFQSINPLVKAPTLVCDDGTVLMDSTLILDYVQTLAAPERRLMPSGTRALHEVGVGLAAMEKTVQVYYEETLRPADKRHAPWHERVSAQMVAGCDAMEQLVHAPRRGCTANASCSPTSRWPSRGASTSSSCRVGWMRRGIPRFANIRNGPRRCPSSVRRLSIEALAANIRNGG